MQAASPTAEHAMPENPPPDRIADLLGSPVQVVNIGLERFADTLRAAGAPVVHVEWTPPAGGDARLIALLDRLGA